jgi:hypothetical protein
MRVVFGYARRAQDVVETVVAHDIMGRLMIQCALQPGLSHVLQVGRFPANG